MLAGLIIVAALLENMWPLLYGLANTPDGLVFLGTVHHPADYFYYLSQFAQGSYRTLTTVNLFTSEPVLPTLVGWSNVATGRLFATLGVPHTAAYHISVALLTVGLLFASFRLSLYILRSRAAATLSLYLFALFHAFPILRDGKPSYGDYFNNVSVPRVRFGGVPHQLLINLASFLLVYGLLRWFDGNRPGRAAAVVFVSSMVLASLQPVLWAVVAGGFIVTYVIHSVIHKRLHDRTRYASLGTILVILAVSGIPPIAYLSSLFATQPFVQLRIWESLQQTRFTPDHFISAAGPVFLMGVAAAPIFVRVRSLSRIGILVLAVISYALFLSPVPGWLTLSHVRFLSALSVYAVSLMAAYGMQTLVAGTRVTRVVFGALLITLTALLIPNHIKTVSLATDFQPTNAYYYLPRSIYAFLADAGAQGAPGDLYLLTWPYNELFPGITGKRSYHGHPLITINAREKSDRVNRLLYGGATQEELQAFLTGEGITHIVVYEDNLRVGTLSGVTRASASAGLVLYAVE